MKKQQIMIFVTLLVLIGLGFLTHFINRPDTFYLDTDSLGVIKADVYSFDNIFQKWSYDIWHSFAITFTPSQPLPGKTMTTTIDWFIAPTLMIPQSSYFILQEDFGNKETILNKDFGINWATYVLQNSLIDGESGKVDFTFVAPTKPGRYHAWYKIVGPNWKEMSSDFKYFSIADTITSCPDAYFTAWNIKKDTSSEKVEFRILHSFNKMEDGTCTPVSRTDYKTICKDGYHIHFESDKVVMAKRETYCQENQPDSTSDTSQKTTTPSSVYCYICDGNVIVSQEFNDMSKCPSGYSATPPPFCGDVNVSLSFCYGCNNHSSVSVNVENGVCPKGYSHDIIDCSVENPTSSDFFEKYKWYLIAGFAFIVIILMGSNQTPGPTFYTLGKGGGLK